MTHYVQRITHVNPVTLESVTKTVVRKVKHSIETLENYARQYRTANSTSINGRTKAGWPVVIEDVGQLTV
jgi:hypothetical protein